MEKETIEISMERVLKTYNEARELGHMDALCAMESLFVKDTMPADKICRILKSRKHEGDKV